MSEKKHPEVDALRTAKLSSVRKKVLMRRKELFGLSADEQLDPFNRERCGVHTRHVKRDYALYL